MHGSCTAQRSVARCSVAQGPTRLHTSRHRTQQETKTVSYAWNMHGLPWTMHGICMEYAWIMYGICMDYVWIMHGLYMDYAWALHGLKNSNPWADPRYSMIGYARLNAGLGTASGTENAGPQSNPNKTPASQPSQPASQASLFRDNQSSATEAKVWRRSSWGMTETVVNERPLQLLGMESELDHAWNM